MINDLCTAIRTDEREITMKYFDDRSIYFSAKHNLLVCLYDKHLSDEDIEERLKQISSDPELRKQLENKDVINELIMDVKQLEEKI